MKNPPTAIRVLLYQGTGSQELAEPLRYEVLRRLLEKGYCATVVSAGGQVSGMAAGKLVVLGRFENGQAPRVDFSGTGAEVLVREIGQRDAEGVVGLVESTLAEAQTSKPGGWKPWFPVIDFDRCTNCMQCLSFCLFDVYGVSEGGKIQVQNQNNCKTDCPACSRVCPEVAILFPKYRFGPINGDQISPEDLRREAMKVDISALLGGDIYSALRDRSAKAKSRFSKERDEDRALSERQRCLQKLHDSMSQMDIPAEVFASLPSPDQIRAKAQEAQARAAAALKQAQSSAIPS